MRATAAAGLAASTAVVGLIAALTPKAPPLAILGGDGVAYDLMARHPLEAVAAYPAAGRLGVPLLVSALPLSVPHAFLVVSLVSIVLAGMVAALIAGELGLPLLHRAAAAALVSGSYLGVHTVYDRYYVDPELLLLVALAFLLALRGSRLWFLCVALLAVFVKEIAVTLAVVPYLLWRPAGRLLDRGALRTAVLFGLPLVAAFLALQTLAPHLPPQGRADGRIVGTDLGSILHRGFLASIPNPLIALFGGVLLAWPLGFLRSPRRLQRAHAWMLVAAPVLILGSWERTLGPFLPLVVAAALFALADAGAPRTVLFTLGSLGATAVAGALTIGNGQTTVAHKLVLVAPGLLVSAAALAPAYAAWLRGLSGPRGRARASAAP